MAQLWVSVIGSISHWNPWLLVGLSVVSYSAAFLGMILLDRFMDPERVWFPALAGIAWLYLCIAVIVAGAWFGLRSLVPTLQAYSFSSWLFWAVFGVGLGALAAGLVLGTLSDKIRVPWVLVFIGALGTYIGGFAVAIALH